MHDCLLHNAEDLDAGARLALIAERITGHLTRAPHPAPAPEPGIAGQLRQLLDEHITSLAQAAATLDRTIPFWKDAWSQERVGWRERAAFLNGDELFGVDYETCRRCKLGWAEQPTTHHEEHRRRGLATAALAALRCEHPGLQWHTLGGHITDSVPFWEAAGRDVPGGYTRRTVCPHTHPGG